MISFGMTSEIVYVALKITVKIVGSTRQLI